MLTSKYLRLSSCGTALMPGTLRRWSAEDDASDQSTHGSAISRSVSLMILFGSAIVSGPSDRIDVLRIQGRVCAGGRRGEGQSYARLEDVRVFGAA